MNKFLVVCAFLCLAFVFSNAHKLHRKIKRNSVSDCDPNKFMIMSRATGYSLGLAVRFQGTNGQNYYWTVTSQKTGFIQGSDIWVMCPDGLKNLYSNQYLYIDGARNAVLVDDQVTKVSIDTNEYPGYNVIKINGECLTTIDDGSSFFAADYFGIGVTWELYQQWNIHYI